MACWRAYDFLPAVVPPVDHALKVSTKCSPEIMGTEQLMFTRTSHLRIESTF
jgi:hypothetical protein